MSVALFTRCPHCQKTSPAHEQQLLTKIACPHCRQAFTVQTVRPEMATSDTDSAGLPGETIASQPKGRASKPAAARSAGQTLPQAAPAAKPAATSAEPTKE